MPSGHQLKQLQLALINAFPSRALLERLLYFELEKNLNEITRDSDLQDIVFKLIQMAESQGWLNELIRVARKENRGNSQLEAIAQELLSPESPVLSQPKILVLTDVSLKQEIQKLESFIKGAVKPNSFEIKVRIVTNPQDIRKAIGEERPSIVHFCSHGTEDGNLVLKDYQGNDKCVWREVLAELFKLYADCVKCVLVNACYSFQSGKAISQYINYVISLEQSIQEKAAIVFTEGFYNELGYNNLNNLYTIPRAFDEGIIALKLDCSEPKAMMPDLWNQGILQGENLSSERNVDYTKLRNFLKSGQWRKADYETGLVMLQVVGRSEGDWIRNEELLNFPCTDLRTIDSLWVKYSNGRFGFSVQKKIYLEVGGKPDRKYYEKAWEKFRSRVGWIVKITFDFSTAYKGHLPLTPFVYLSAARNSNDGLRPYGFMQQTRKPDNTFMPRSETEELIYQAALEAAQKELMQRVPSQLSLEFDTLIAAGYITNLLSRIHACQL